MTDAEAMKFSESLAREIDESILDEHPARRKMWKGQIIKFARKTLQLAVENERERILKIVNDWWRFAEDQQPVSSWHDKQDCLLIIRQSNQEESKCRFG